MKRQGYPTVLCVAVLLSSLAGCASSSSGIERRPLPSYASTFITTQGLNSWTVRCPLQSITGNDDRDTSMFYKSDGTEKTLIEFCDEYDSSTRIPAGVR